MKNTRTSNNKLLKLTAMFAFPCALFGGMLMGSTHTAQAQEQSPTYHYEEKHVTNYTFSEPKGSAYLEGSSLSGWSVTEDTKNLPGRGMIIDVGSKIETGDGSEAETSNFAKYKDHFALDTNPGAKDSDTRILMLNSKENKSQSNRDARKGYSSSSIELNANSYHIIKISAKAMKNGDASVEGSIYLTGIKDKDGKALKLAYEKISPQAWTDYYFLVATGNKAQTVKIECYLGSKTSDSSGVMFFDSSSVYRYSQNQFFDYAFTNYGYTGNDVLTTEGTKIFAIDALADEKSTLAQISGYNFDFEDTSKSLASNWEPLGQTNGTAKIAYYADFGTDSTLAGIGDNFEYNNSRALVMQCTSQAYDSKTQYVGLKSKEFTIEPHACYKVSLDVKVSNMQRGSFYVKVSENGTIYDTYSFIDEDDVPLSSGKTNGQTDNDTNEWTNNYQTLTYYIKGHSLYYSNVNLELWLGDAQTPATGTAVIDNISVEKVDESAVSSSDLLTLNSNAPTLNITNGSFDSALASVKDKAYPLSASSWNVAKANDKNCSAGVVYLADNATYDQMYDGYAWAGINPNNNADKAPNNVFMMFNSDNSYQTLTSPKISLSGSEYHSISFDYYHQDYRNLRVPSMKVEVVDDNGIVLFSQDGITSLNDWATMKILFKTNSSKSHSATMKIYFGQNETDKMVGGMCYLDNFSTTTSDSNAFKQATYKTDITGFLTHLDFASGANANRITSTSAYTFSATSLDSDYTNAQSAVGGIVNGQNNEFDITNENDNFLAITNISAAKSSLKTNFKLDEFAANSYYKLSFSLATIFNDDALDASTDDHECGYGVSILIDGFEEVAHIVNNGTLQDYEIYFKTSDTASTPTLEFILNSDCAKTVGTALLTNLSLSASDVDKYTAVKGYSSYGQTKFTSDFVVVEEETPEEDTTPDQTPDSETTQSNTDWGIIASSLITSVAVIIGVVALAFRSVKLKKIEKVKAEAYDKRVTENHEVIMAKAQKLRDKELETLNLAKATIENEKAELEAVHKEFVKEQRIKDSDKISKDMEKAFKVHAAKQSNLNEKLRILKEKIDYTMSAEHLIELERRVVAEQDEQKVKIKKKK